MPEKKSHTWHSEQPFRFVLNSCRKLLPCPLHPHSAQRAQKPVTTHWWLHPACSGLPFTAHSVRSIYHNVSLRAPLKRAERDSAANTAKRDALSSENQKNASGSFSARCIAMHESEWRTVWVHTVPMRHIFRHFQFVNSKHFLQDTPRGAARGVL